MDEPVSNLAIDRTEEPIAILAVDDQPENLLALEAIFTDPGLQLITARSGKEALKKLLHGEFALILMDAQMPDMDGFETAAAVRSREKTRLTPIIFLTAAHKDSFHAAIGYEIGAVDYIFKPLQPEILKAKVSVFVELFKKTKEIQKQAEALAAYKTELERSLSQQQALNAELQEMSQAAAAARDMALSASRFKSEFLANMSHEIRTPMNGILGMIEILMQSGLNDKQQQYADSVKEAGRSLLAVINDILDFSKVEAGKLTLEQIEFKPSRLVEDIAELLALDAKQHALTLLTFVDPEIPLQMIGDPVRLRQILTNLIGNAIKFSNNSAILVRAVLESSGDFCRIKFSVCDQGIGMTDEEIGRLFQPFVQADSSTLRKYGGTGLGLSICKRLVELMGGAIGVSSVKGHGSTFWFSVPLKVSSSETIKQLAPQDLRGLNVMVVDDDPTAGEILQNYLNSWGMRNEFFQDAEQALARLRSASKDGEPFRLAIIDLVMPGMDGMQLEKRIREDSDLKDMKLILLTAFDKPGAREEAGMLGFDAYLTKPVRQSQLLDVITMIMYKADQAALQAEHKRNEELALQPSASQQLRPELILVAEDHPINQKVAILLLKQLAFEAHIASNGKQALEMLKQTPYSLVFMDCQMPLMDGFEATKAIRANEGINGKHLPIIAMTAHAIEGSREQCIATGMDDYLSKPVSVDGLRRILGKWLPLHDASNIRPAKTDSSIQAI